MSNLYDLATNQSRPQKKGEGVNIKTGPDLFGVDKMTGKVYGHPLLG